jgi:hypothetical protein
LFGLIDGQFSFEKLIIILVKLWTLSRTVLRTLLSHIRIIFIPIYLYKVLLADRFFKRISDILMVQHLLFITICYYIMGLFRSIRYNIICKWIVIKFL